MFNSQKSKRLTCYWWTLGVWFFAPPALFQMLRSSPPDYFVFIWCLPHMIFLISTLAYEFTALATYLEFRYPYLAKGINDPFGGFKGKGSAISFLLSFSPPQPDSKWEQMRAVFNDYLYFLACGILAWLASLSIYT